MEWLNRNKISVLIALGIIAILGYFAFVKPVGATNNWQYTYGDCVANDGTDCQNNGGWREVTKTRTYHDWVCDKWFIICLKGHWEEKTQTETYLEDCEVVPPACEDPIVPPSPHGDGGSSDPGATQAPAHKVCTVPFEVARTWYADGMFHWANDAQGIQKFSIVYGDSPDNMIYGVDNIDAKARSINIERPDWNQTWFSVWTWVDGCANKSEAIDP